MGLEPLRFMPQAGARCAAQQRRTGILAFARDQSAGDLREALRASRRPGGDAGGGDGGDCGEDEAMIVLVLLAWATCNTIDGKTCVDYPMWRSPGGTISTWCVGPDGPCTPEENTRHHIEIDQQDKCRAGGDTTRDEAFRQSYLACMRDHGYEKYK
jgi:hypothetical protein